MSSQLLPVQSGYDRWATVYDHDANPLPALDTPIVRAAIHAVAPDLYGQQVLDLGCGTGRHTIWLAEQGAQVTGLDFSEGMLAQARRKSGAAGIRFLRHDLHQPLPLNDEEFGLVVSSLVLEHLADLDQFFGEARRVLRPGGHAVVSAMHPAMFLRGSQARFRPRVGRARPAGEPSPLAERLRHGGRAGGLSAERPSGDQPRS